MGFFRQAVNGVIDEQIDARLLVILFEQPQGVAAELAVDGPPRPVALMSSRPRK